MSLTTARERINYALVVSRMATVDPDMAARIQACSDALPDVPERLLMRLPAVLRDVMTDAMAEARQDAESTP